MSAHKITRCNLDLTNASDNLFLDFAVDVLSDSYTFLNSGGYFRN